MQQYVLVRIIRLDNVDIGLFDWDRNNTLYFFALNGEIGLQKHIRDLPRTFRVMLYGFGTSENNWDSISVVTPKQQ